MSAPGGGSSAREARLRAILAALVDTEPGRELGLRRVATLEDFRASVPVFDAASHAERVRARLGFGAEALDAEALTAGALARPRLHARWRARAQLFESSEPRALAMLHARVDDPLVDQLRVQDLSSFGAPSVVRIDTIVRGPRDGPSPAAETLEALHRARPELLAVPSLATVAWLEQPARGPIERALPSLRALMAECDFEARLRSRLPVLNGGWLHPAGRVGLPAERGPVGAFVLATDSTLIELLPHGDPELEARSSPSSQVGVLDTALPEHAVLGERYELVLSSPLGFLRLRSGLHVRVIGYEASEGGRPRPRVVRLPPPPPDVALEGVTLPGAWLTACVRQSFLPEDPALVSAEIAADPDALDPDVRASRSGLDPFADTELGTSRALFRKGPKPRALAVRIEVHGQSEPNFPVLAANRIDEDLCRRCPAYGWLRERNELWEPRVVIAWAGTAASAKRRRVRSLAEPVERPVVRIAR